METGKKVKATVLKLDKSHIVEINKTRRFDFNWNKEKNFPVYALYSDGNDQPLGLMSLNNRVNDYAIEIRLLASSKENIGRNKRFGSIAGCLIAFACLEAFKAGYGGYVCLKSKTELKQYYRESYGMISTKLYLITEGQNSLQLIKKYYENEN